MNSGNPETFFLPQECDRHDWTVPINLYRLYRKRLRDSRGNWVFVPVRSMQFLAVIDDEEVVFVDSQAYMVHNDVGGRVILLAWRFAPAGSLDSLTEPVPCTVVHYQPHLKDVQRRLVGEFTKALELLEQRHLESQPPATIHILPFGKE